MAELQPTFPEHVAAQLSEQLQQGQAPWQRSWRPGEVFMPINAKTGQRYKGINALHLMAQNHTDSRWLTANQAFEVDGQLQQGAVGTAIQFYKFTEEQIQRDSAGRELLDSNGQSLKVRIALAQPRLLMATVFNAEQIDGELPLPLPSYTKTFSSLWQTLQTLDDRALDLPDQNTFAEIEDYQTAVLRQWAHWTAGQSDIKRDGQHPFGSEGYAQEKLRVEIASMLLGHELGIGYQPQQQAACVPLWINMLNKDPQALFCIARDAEKICNYVLTINPQQRQQTSQPQEERIYFDVPYEQKDEVKALGAHWDAQQKSWYVEASVDRQPFAPWRQVSASHLSLSPEERQYLAVPFEERNQAKQLGALWDQQAGSWYVGPQVDTLKLQRWVSHDGTQSQPSVYDARAEFSSFLKSMGCHVDGGHPRMDGQWHRIGIDGDGRGETSGSYRAHCDGRPSGYVMNYRKSQGTTWVSKGYELDPQQQAVFRAQAAMKAQEWVHRQERVREDVAEDVNIIVTNALIAISNPTPYLLKKSISPQSGIFTDQERKNTYIPATDENGKLWTLQTIDAQGDKRFKKGGRKTGCFHVMGGFEKLATVPTIVISEGYATAASVSQALGYSTVAAFDAGNLKSVAEALHLKYPYKPIVIAGDDDRHTELTQGYNTGKEKALAAAAAVGGKAIFPHFAAAEVPASVDITLQRYRQHENATKELKNSRAEALTQDQIKTLKEQQLNSQQLKTLNTMKTYTDFNDLVTKSTLSAETIQNQIRTAVNEDRPRIDQTQQAEHQVQSPMREPKKQSRSIRV